MSRLHSSGQNSFSYLPFERFSPLSFIHFLPCMNLPGRAFFCLDFLVKKTAVNTGTSSSSYYWQHFVFARIGFSYLRPFWHFILMVVLLACSSWNSLALEHTNLVYRTVSQAEHCHVCLALLFVAEDILCVFHTCYAHFSARKLHWDRHDSVRYSSLFTRSTERTFGM